MLERRQIRTALVTGGARRLGRGIVTDLARNGFAVAIHANTSIDAAELLAEELRWNGAAAVAVKADLRDIGETEGLVEAARAALGPIGLLINNASVFLEDTAHAFNAETQAAHFDVHVRAPMILASHFQALLPDEAEGMIVNIVDQRVWALNPRFFSYTLSKSALWTATRTMAQAFAPRIRVNAIAPGPTLKSDRQEERDFQTQIDMLPLQRGPMVEEFGKTIRFLFDTPSITGQMIALDGGQHLAWTIPGAEEIRE